MSKAECIIIGAGLSGLASALTLHKNGIESRVIELENCVGGRVKTIKTSDGYITDVGFQVLLSSYPELQNFVDLNSLNLKKFHSGALVYNGKNLDLLANPIVHPNKMFSSFMNEFISLKDKALILKLILISQRSKSDIPLGEISTSNFLKDFGFSENFIEYFWRPFLTGIFLDPELEIGEQFFKFLMNCFSKGKVSIPENGMIELPLQMAQNLPSESILLNQRIRSWSPYSVTLESGEVITAKKVICSIDPNNLKAEPTENNFRMVTTHYFTGENIEQTNWSKWLVLMPRKFGFAIDHFCLISEVSKKYGNGNSLLSVSLIGKKDIGISQIINEINRIAKRDLKLQLVISHTVPKALPRKLESTEGFKIIDDVVYSGDRWTSPSINGALKSGRLAAEYVTNEIRK